jgi:thiol:disulfide interchange protein DsbD
VAAHLDGRFVYCVAVNIFPSTMRHPVWLALLALLIAAPAGAASRSAPVERDHVVVELVSEVESIRPGEPFRVGLAIAHAPEWHTYWRNPGDSGLETRFAWTLPPGFEAGPIQWPWPERHEIEHLVNYGYSGEILLPVRLTPPQDLQPGAEIPIRLKADWLVCRIECIPGSAELSLTLPVSGDPAPPSAFAGRFERADDRRPRSVDWPATFAVQGDRVGVRVRTDTDLDPEALRFFPAHPTLVEHADEPFIAADAGTLQISQARSPFFSSAPERLEFVLVDTGGQRAWSLSAEPGAMQTTGPPDATTADERPFWLLLLMALAGGVLLNLMPCVFPVLSLKAMSLVSGGSGAPRAHAGAYTAGVLVSFTALAALLLALRAAGEAIGWGFQLQSPWFVGLLAFLLFAMGLSLSGVFELGTRWMGMGQRLTEREGLRGSFFTGVLATLVASPCTAPFMGTALGLAVLLPSWQAMSVFLALGLGLALPLAAVGAVPALARLLPRPGPWMDTFKQLMAFPLYLTVVWLVWVFAGQTGPDGVAALLGGLVALAFALWLAGRPAARRPTAVASHAAVALALLGALAALGSAIRNQAGPVDAADANWEPFSEQRLAEVNADPEQAAFVNMTADWCVTCLVNERVALNTERVRSAMRDHDVVYFKGDWTRRDPAITRYLERFDRSGVPLYVFYPAAGADAPVVLPQILTPAAVADILSQR